MCLFYYWKHFELYRKATLRYFNPFITTRLHEEGKTSYNLQVTRSPFSKESNEKGKHLICYLSYLGLA